MVFMLYTVRGDVMRLRIGRTTIWKAEVLVVVVYIRVFVTTCSIISITTLPALH